MTSSRDDAPARPPSALRPVLGVAALAVLLLVAVLAVVAGAPARPRGAEAPVQVFSAARAMDELEEIADVPRPVGSSGHTRAREHLLVTLEAWGWRTEVQEAVGVTDFAQPGTQPVALARNVVATWPGTDPTGTVVLAAHYDTVAGSPGAADDGIGVGTVLEVARALSTEGAAPLRNDVVVLITDAEEAGLLGAEAFARERASSLGEAVVLNHEARGAWGAPTTFRTTSPNGVLLDALSRAPGASAESSSEAAFEALPNGTDFTPLTAAGMHALDTAIAAGSAHYHSPVDDLEHLSPASVQQMGDTSLALATELAAADLVTVADGDEQLVTTLPWGLLRYPRAAEGPLALAALVGAGALVVVRRRRRLLTLPRTALSAAVAVVALLAAGAAGWATWQLALLVDAGQASAVVGEPYRPTPYAAAVLTAAAGVVLGGYALARRRLGAVAVATGAVTALAAAGTLLTPVPGLSGLLTLPVLCAVAGGLAAEVLPERAALARGAAVLIGSAGVVLLLGPGAWVAPDVGLATGGPAGAVFLGALVLLVLPVVELAWPRSPTPRRRQAWRTAAVPVTVLLVAAVMVAAGLVANREGATAPRQEQLVYVLDTGTGQALWASRRSPVSAWSAALLTEPPARLDAVPRAEGALLAHGPAPVVDLPAPEVTVLAETTRDDGRRDLVLRLSSPRGAPAVGLWVDVGSATVRQASVAGRALPVNGAFGRWDFGFVLEGAPADGTEVRLTLDQYADALAVRVADRSDSLAAVPGSTPPRGRVLVTPQLWVARELAL